MTMKNVLVTGASGSIGSEIVREAVAKGLTVRAASRRGTAEAGAEGFVFDYEKPETYPAALAGVEAVVLIAPPLDTQAYEKMLPFLNEALKEDRKLVLISAYGIEYAPESALGKLEAYIQQHTQRWTILRPSFFMENFSTGFLSGMVQGGTIYLNAGEGKTGFISTVDIAAVAVQALLDEKHNGQAYGLTGAEALDHHEVVAKINAGAGASLHYVPVSDEAMLQGMLQGGVPQSGAEQAAGMYSMVAQGIWGGLSDGVEKVLGRSATSFDAFVQANARYWKK